MKRFAFILSLLIAGPLQAATHTVYWTAATGGTYYAFPATQSLGSWDLYKVPLTEVTSPTTNLGRYVGIVDDAQGTSWYLFSGSSQPSTWASSVAQTSVIVKSNLVQISDDPTSADNLESYTDGTTPQPVNATQFAGTAYATAIAAWIDAAWDEAASGHATAGTFGAYVSLLADATNGLAAIKTAVSAITAIGQPRVNKKPPPAFTIAVSNRADGTHKAPLPIRITPGAVDNIFVFLDLSPLFGKDDFVRTVGTPTVEAGGSLTASAEGPRDYYAVIELDGTATASEERTITVPVTMDSGETLNVLFDVKVFAE